MPQDGSEQPTGEVYLLFAHEAYYPADAQEINTSLIAAASLLNPRVRQPDGARIYDRLTRGRRPGGIVPLATLTHELDGGRAGRTSATGKRSPRICSSSSRTVNATPSAWACPTSPVPWCAPARTARYGSTTRRPGGIRRPGPPNTSRSWARSAGNWRGRKPGAPCGRVTACWFPPTPEAPSDVRLRRVRRGTDEMRLVR